MAENANQAKKIDEPTDRREGRSLLLIILAVLIVVSYGLFGSHRSRFIIKSKFAIADGLRTGAEVEVAGVKAGNVEQIRFLEIPQGNKEPEIFELILSLSPEIDGHPIGEIIRKDGFVVLVQTGALGERSINIETGSPTAPPTQSGDYLASKVEPTVAMVFDQSETARLNFLRTREILEETTKWLEAHKGTVGKFGDDNSDFERNLKDLSETTDQLQHMLTSGKGTIGRFHRDNKFAKRLDELVKQGEALADLLNNGKGTIGRFNSDDQFRTRVEHLQKRVNGILDRYNKVYDKALNGNGDLARFNNDKQFINSVKELQGRVSNIGKSLDMRKGTVGLILNDHRLSDNVATISSEMLKLVYDIRQKPTKYVKFTLF